MSVLTWVSVSLDVPVQRARGSGSSTLDRTITPIMLLCECRACLVLRVSTYLPPYSTRTALSNSSYILHLAAFQLKHTLKLMGAIDATYIAYLWVRIYVLPGKRVPVAGEEGVTTDSL